jgi:putative transposase
LSSTPLIYTTNAAESLDMTLQKLINTRGSFPTEDAAPKLLYMGLKNVSRKWSFITGWRKR